MSCLKNTTYWVFLFHILHVKYWIKRPNSLSFFFIILASGKRNRVVFKSRLSGSKIRLEKNKGENWSPKQKKNHGALMRCCSPWRFSKYTTAHGRPKSKLQRDRACPECPHARFATSITIYELRHLHRPGNDFEVEEGWRWNIQRKASEQIHLLGTRY